MTASPVTFAILAGGEAKRLGGIDKGLELLDERPLVAWVIDAVGAMGEFADGLPSNAAGEPCVRIVANRNRAEYARYALTIADRMPGYRGPLAGVSTALAACETAWMLTLPVDCPMPPQDLARRLLSASQELQLNCVVAHDGVRRQPLFALYAQSLCASASAGVAAGQGVREWQDSIGAFELDMSHARQHFVNLNTREDFSAYAAQARFAR